GRAHQQATRAGRAPTSIGIDPLSGSAVWPDDTAVGRSSHLSVSGLDLVRLADRYGTPLYVYDAATIRAAYRAQVRALRPYRPARVSYAIKACPLIGVAAIHEAERSRELAATLVAFARELGGIGARIREIGVGGGLKIPLRPGDHVLAATEHAAAIGPIVRDAGDLRATIYVEPGRGLV